MLRRAKGNQAGRVLRGLILVVPSCRIRGIVLLNFIVDGAIPKTSNERRREHDLPALKYLVLITE